MLDLFLKLIDRILDLAKRREEVDRRLYAEFVAPAFADFAVVHKNYLDSFIQYREMISNKTLTLDQRQPILERAMALS